jgi:pentatricopeptide repeat protein
LNHTSTIQQQGGYERTAGDITTESSESEPKQDATTGNSDQVASSSRRTYKSVGPRGVPKMTVKKILFREGLRTSYGATVHQRLNHEIQREGRKLSDKSIAIATSTRGKSIYSAQQSSLKTWQRAYEEVYKAKHYKRKINDPSIIPVLNKTGEVLLGKIQEDCSGAFAKFWHTSERDVKARHWQALAFWLLQNDVKLFLNFLIVTMKGTERPDFTMVTDCLLYVDNFYYEELKDWTTGRNSHGYPWVIEYCLRPSTWPVVSPPQKGIRLYIRRARPYGVRLAFRTMKARGIQSKPETQLCFVNRFTQLGDANRALSALKLLPRLKDPAFTMDAQGVLRHCCKLLTLDTVEDGESGRNFRILPQLLEMGVRPDRDMMNVVLANAYKTGDHELGADMLQFMTSQDYTFDSYTYVTLLTNAVLRGDQARTHELIREVDTKEEIRKNPYVANKIFHAHYVFTAKHMDADVDPSGVFYSMLDMYNKLHDITPLKELLIIPPHYKAREEGANTPPTPMALYIMIATYFRCGSRISTVQRIYSRFAELVKQGHPTIAPLAATDHTYNEFLIALRKSSRAMHSCVRIVEDMLQPRADLAIEHAKPSYRTWAILLSVFLWHRRPAAAEKIREMMAKHEVPYNDVTWNLIINGYANAQKVQETAAAMKAMEAQGFTLDSYTMKSLRYLRDPERLWVAVDELDHAAQEADFAARSSTEQSPAAIEDALRDDLIEKGLQKLGDKNKAQD